MSAKVMLKSKRPLNFIPYDYRNYCTVQDLLFDLASLGSLSIHTKYPIY